MQRTDGVGRAIAYVVSESSFPLSDEEIAGKLAQQGHNRAQVQRILFAGGHEAHGVVRISCGLLDLSDRDSRRRILMAKRSALRREIATLMKRLESECGQRAARLRSEAHQSMMILRDIERRLVDIGAPRVYPSEFRHLYQKDPVGEVYGDSENAVTAA